MPIPSWCACWPSTSRIVDDIAGEYRKRHDEDTNKLANSKKDLAKCEKAIVRLTHECHKPPTTAERRKMIALIKTKNEAAARVLANTSKVNTTVNKMDAISSYHDSVRDAATAKKVVMVTEDMTKDVGDMVDLFGKEQKAMQQLQAVNETMRDQKMVIGDEDDQLEDAEEEADRLFSGCLDMEMAGASVLSLRRPGYESREDDTLVHRNKFVISDDDGKSGRSTQLGDLDGSDLDDDDDDGVGLAMIKAAKQANGLCVASDDYLS